jgi:hypothetical protein
VLNEAITHLARTGGGAGFLPIAAGPLLAGGGLLVRLGRRRNIAEGSQE